MERKHKRATRLSVPHVETSQLRSSTPDSLDLQALTLEEGTLDDAWTREAADDGLYTPRKTHLRRASTAAGNSTKHKGTPTQDMESSMAKLEKQNFDLKIRVCMQEERAKKLELELQEALNKIKDLAQVNEYHDRTTEEQEEKIRDLETANASLVSDNQEMFELYDELVVDLEQKDTAISEAADMVCEVEDKKEALETELAQSNEKILSLQEEVERWKALAGAANKGTDSDYYSAGTERSDAKIPVSIQSDSRPSSARQSDYFSAESTTTKTPQLPSPLKDARGLKGRLQNLKKSMKSYRTQRVGELRARSSYSTLDLTSESMLSQAPPTSYKSSRDDLLQRMQAPVTESTADNSTEASSAIGWSGARRGSVPNNIALRNRYFEGEHVGGLAQLRAPKLRNADVLSPITASSANSTPRPQAAQRSNSSCSFHSPPTTQPSGPIARENRRTSRGRPDLSRLTTTIPSSTSTVGSGILDRTTAWLGTLPRPGGDTPRDMIFNRNADEFGPVRPASTTPHRRDTTSRVLWP